jgi:hypothetical protein
MVNLLNTMVAVVKISVYFLGGWCRMFIHALHTVQKEEGQVCLFSYFLQVLFFSLWLYSPYHVLAASMKLSVSLLLLDLGQSVGLLDGWSRHKASTCTQTQKNSHTTQSVNIHALSGIRTHGPGVRASENSSYHRPAFTGNTLMKFGTQKPNV